MMFSANKDYLYILSSHGDLATSVRNSNADNSDSIWFGKLNKGESQKLKFVPIKIFDTGNYVVIANKIKLQVDRIKELVRFLKRDGREGKMKKYNRSRLPVR